MRPPLLPLCCLLMTATGCSEGPHPPDFYLGGIQVNEGDLGDWFDALEDAGMNTVSVTEYARHGAWDSDDLTWAEEDRDLVHEIRGAKQRGLAVILILRVELDPDLERNKYLWHGMILPRGEARLASWFDKYERFVRQWAEIAEREGVDVLMIGSELNALASTLPLTAIPGLEEYYLNADKQDERRHQVLANQDAIADDSLAWAEERGESADLEEYLDDRIARERSWAQQTVLDGGEPSLDSLNQRRQRLKEHWTGLISRLREVYRGRLGYAANFDQYRDVAFWKELDLIGINAYFKLRQRPLPPEVAATGAPPELAGELVEGWRSALGEIAAFRAAQGLDEPVIFTEMGYTYRLNSTLEPWSDAGFSLVLFDGREQVVVWRDQPDFPEERTLAVRALYQAHRELASPFLEGILYWKLSTNPNHRDHESFLVVIGQSQEDPVLAELRRFVGDG
jgi:Glycoside Hydrolase Family 113